MKPFVVTDRKGGFILELTVRAKDSGADCSPKACAVVTRADRLYVTSQNRTVRVFDTTDRQQVGNVLATVDGATGAHQRQVSPTVSADPGSITVRAGERAEFTAAAGATPTPTPTPEPTPEPAPEPAPRPSESTGTGTSDGEGTVAVLAAPRRRPRNA
ncbi:hypothetical protein ACFVW2_18265 [Streptomyces sp. NPDC058171]